MKSKQKSIRGLKSIYGNERGMVLAIALVLLGTLLLFGTTAALMTSTDIRIGGHYKSSEQALYVAEGGAEEGRQRLRLNATDPIVDSHPTQTGWAAYIGSDTKAQGKGYNSGNAMHVRKSSYQTALDYTVVVKHKTNSSGNILYWGDHDDNGVNTRTTAAIGPNIYLVTSYGSSAAGANKIIEVECTKNVIAVPAPLYVKANTTIMGTSTNIMGGNAGSEYTMPDGTSCGNNPKHGLVTPLTSGSITTSGNPTIAGEGGGTEDITYNGPNLDIQSLINNYKGSANYSYNLTSATLTGMNWGTPTLGATLQDPSSCSVSNIVYYNTNATYVSLVGGSQGCGILLVDGDLSIGGNFSWYGVILASGAITFTGGGNKQVTGAVLSDGSVDADMVGGNTNIVYCGKAILDQAQNQPMLALSWREVN